MNRQKYTPVRFSHLTSYSGVGSIVRGAEDKLMAIVDIRHWTDKDGNNTATPIPYVDRIVQSLGIGKELRIPPKGQEVIHKGSKEIEGNYLPAVLFPTYAKCKKCGLLHPNPWRHQNKKFDEQVYCQDCNGILEQVVWCCVSNQGHLDDVPWHAICHKEFRGKCETDYQANYLKFTNEKGKQVIKCTKCRSSNLYGQQQLGFMGKPQPWIYESVELKQNFRVDIVEVNSPTAYLPESVTALVIPPESRISKTTVVDRLYNNSTALRELESIGAPLRKEGKLKELATKYKSSVEDIKNAITQIDRGYPNFDITFTDSDLTQEEYKAFLTLLENVRDDEDFVTEHKTQQWKLLKDEHLGFKKLSALITLVDNHIVAKRLRKISIFKGFKRGIQEGEQSIVPPDIVGKSNWLPAIELFGEGIFFTLDEGILSKWEALLSVKKRAAEVSERYEKSALNLGDDIVITARFILLHTLAHLIIRELETSAGYPAASLSERIYHSKNAKMAGILIYTAVPDVVGSLGGIVESAQPKAFLKILNNAFKQAQWCSIDPVCAEHQGQGPGWLNRAACHGCVLVPETACEYSNVFLDRVFIKGSKDLNIPNFLEFVLSNYGKENI